MSHHLGQCILHNTSTLEGIFDVVQSIYAHQPIREIWPGPWVMTRYLHTLDHDLIAYELDTKYKNKLTNYHIVRWDVLSTRTAPTQDIFVYWSLPYYITSPLLQLMTDQHITWVYVIQHEVWRKIASHATKKSYLRWLLNFTHTITYHHTIDRSEFAPIPQVDSCVISMMPHDRMWDDRQHGQMIKLLDMLHAKRKTIGAQFKHLGKSYPAHLWSKRLEQLQRHELFELAHDL